MLSARRLLEIEPTLWYIHPHMDGNGRMARFLMKVMLASGGYPWTVIRVEDRDDYLHALDSASIDGDIKPFAQFIIMKGILAGKNSFEIRRSSLNKLHDRQVWRIVSTAFWNTWAPDSGATLFPVSRWLARR
jgi:Fic family protein